MPTITLTTEEEVLYQQELLRIRDLIPDLNIKVLLEPVPLPVASGNDRYEVIRQQFLKEKREQLKGGELRS